MPSGGGKRALYYHVRGLVERGHTVEAWCPSTADQRYLPINEFINEHILPLKWKPRTAKNHLSRFTATYRDVTDKIQAMDQHCQQCAEEINCGNFDLLFANACMFFRVTSIGRYTQIPKVIYLQEPYRWLYEAMPKLPWIAQSEPEKSWWSPFYLKNFLHDLIKVQGLRVQAREELLNAQAFDSILVNSFFSRESILRAYGLDATVCYLGIDSKLFFNQSKQKENLIVGIGAFVPEKNIKFVIEALAGINVQLRPRLVWIGNVASTSYLEEIKRFAKSVAIDFEARVRIEDEELLDVLNRAMMMVYAPRLEPFGFAPLEANACEVPVIAVAEGGVREVVIDGVNGLLVEHNVKSMADAIQRLINDKAYARKLGENGRQLVLNKWSLDASIERLEYRFTNMINTVNQ